MHLTIYSCIIMCDGVSPTKTLWFHLNEDLGSFDISHHAQPDTFHFPLIVIMGSSSFWLWETHTGMALAEKIYML